MVVFLQRVQGGRGASPGGGLEGTLGGMLPRRTEAYPNATNGSIVAVGDFLAVNTGAPGNACGNPSGGDGGSALGTFGGVPFEAL